MRKGLSRYLFIALALGSAPSAMAANYGTAGCGIGAMAFRDQPGKIQIVAATLNNIISPQTSAITSGTSNCSEDDGREEASLFIAINQEALRNDISRGNGETLANLSRLLQCEDSTKLGNTLQKNYRAIFPSSETKAQEVSESIEKTIKGDQELAATCRNLV